MKRFFISLLSIILVLTLVACSKDIEETEDVTNDSKTTSSQATTKETTTEEVSTEANPETTTAQVAEGTTATTAASTTTTAPNNTTKQNSTTTTTSSNSNTTTTTTEKSKPDISIPEVNIDPSNITIPTKDNSTSTTRDKFADTCTAISTAISSSETLLSNAKSYCNEGKYNYAIGSAAGVSAQMTAAIEACKTDSRLSDTQAALQSCKDQISGLTKYYNDDSDAAHKAIKNAISSASKSLSTAKSKLNSAK